jgi:hypothetical protein
MFFLLFSTDFTRIRKITSLFELPICRKALEKNPFLEMWPLGRPARLRPKSGEGRRRGWPETCVGRRGWPETFRSELGAEMAGGEASGGAQRRQPLRSQLRRGLGQGEGVERLGCFLRGYEMWRKLSMAPCRPESGAHRGWP